MLFYQVQVTSQQKITSLTFYTDAMDSTYAKVKPTPAYTEYLENHIDEYAMQNNGYYLRPIIKAVEEQQFSLLACCKYEINKGHDLAKYIKELFSEVFDMQLVYEQVVEETYQQRLAEPLSKQSFEAPVGERIDVFAHSPMYCLHCKYTTKLCNDKEIDALFAISGGCSGLHCTNQAAHAP